MTEPSHQSSPYGPSSLSPAAPIERPLWMLAGPGLGTALAAFQFGVLLVLLGTIQREFGSPMTIVAVVVAHLLAAALGFAPGYLLGRRAPTAIVAPALVLMLIGAVVTTLAGAPAVLIVAELLIGLGAGAVLGAAAALSGQVSQERRRQVRLAFGLAALGGLVFGLLLGWLVMTTLSWRLACLLAVPMALIALVVTVAGGVAAMMRAQK